jgi:O-antigen ligase
MAADSLRYEATGSHSWIAVAVGMLALALGSGYALALGEMAGLYVALSLACAVAVLIDFRVGAVALLLMLPMSASALFPHNLLNIKGLDPLNLIVLAALGAYILRGRLHAPAALVPMPLVGLFIVPIVLAAWMGMGRVDEIPAFFYERELITFDTPVKYFLHSAIRPMVLVGVALLIGAAAAQSKQPERFIVPIALSALLVALIQIGFVIIERPSLAALASTGERSFYTPIGLHANDLGRLHLFAAALLVFVWAETKRPQLKLFLLITLSLLGLALLLSFSRAAIGAAVLVGALFLVWKFNARTLALSVLGVALAALFAADALYSRMTMGFGEGADAVSAGRIDGIWLPLLSEFWKSPLIGEGLRSILWSFPMQNEGMIRAGHAHNAYLEALLDMGIVGLVLLLAYYSHVWKGLRSLSRDERLSPEMRGLFQGACAALVAFLVTCMVGASLRPQAEAAYIWVAIGLMYGMRGLLKQR